MAAASKIVRRTVWFLDTSVLLELLEVPGHNQQPEECRAKFAKYAARGDEMRLPAATLLETGHHIELLESGTARRESATRLTKTVEAALDGRAPWAYTPMTWSEKVTRKLLEGHYPDVGMVEAIRTKFIEMGDMMIIAEFQEARANMDPRIVDVDVWTLDRNLRQAVDVIKAG